MFLGLRLNARIEACIVWGDNNKTLYLCWVNAMVDAYLTQKSSDGACPSKHSHAQCSLMRFDICLDSSQKHCPTGQSLVCKDSSGFQGVYRPAVYAAGPHTDQPCMRLEHSSYTDALACQVLGSLS